MAFHPYLNFGGNCRDAFTRYQEIFGGELTMMTFAEMPPGEGEPMPAEQSQMIMHAALMVGGNLLMASDDPSPEFHPMKGMYVNCSVDDVAEAERIFAALAEGGDVQMPIGETFWAPRFGMCVDRFGAPWMVNAEPPAGAS